MKTNQLVWMPRTRQDEQGLVQRGNNPLKYPDRDTQRHQNQQASQQPFTHGCHQELALGAAGATAGAGAGAGDGAAAPEPEVEPAAGDVVAAVPGLAATGADSPDLVSLPDSAAGAPDCAPPRKSVTYQPEPLS